MEEALKKPNGIAILVALFQVLTSSFGLMVLMDPNGIFILPDGKSNKWNKTK